MLLTNTGQRESDLGRLEILLLHFVVDMKRPEMKPMNSFDMDSLPPPPRPFQIDFNAAGHDPMEHRHKIRPVQLFVPSNSNPNALRLNKNALNAVLNHASVGNRKVSDKRRLKIS